MVYKVADNIFQNEGSFEVIKNNDDLTHHGILGQKWGVRRYQNEDGTLTAAGKKRVADRSNTDVYADKYQRDQRNQSVYNSASSAARSLSNIATRSAQSERNRVRGKIDLSQISDSDLRAMLNRMDLEKRYREMSTETIGTGKRNLSDMLQTVGDVLAVGASAAAIIGAIHQYKSRK